MSTIIKYRLTFFLLLSVGLALGVSMLYWHRAFGLGLIVWPFIASWILNSVRCPVCGESVTHIPEQTGFLRHVVWTTNHCRSCGADLTARPEVRKERR